MKNLETKFNIMKKSEISDSQAESRKVLLSMLQASGWTLRHLENYENDLFFCAELSARKRNNHAILELNISYENKYVSINIAKFEVGAAQYVIYFDKITTAKEILVYINQQSDELSVSHCIELGESLCEKYTGEVFFFTGEASIELNKNNVKQVFNQFNDIIDS